MNEKYKKLASNTIIFAIGNICSKIIQFVLLPLYTAYMTESAYGEGELLNSLTQLIYPVIALCLYEAMFRFVLDRDADPKAVFSTAISLVCLLAPLSLVVGFFLEYYVGIDASLFCALLSVTSVFRICTMNFIRGLGAVKRFAISGVLNAAVLLAGTLILICWLRLGASGYLLNLILADCCTILFLFVSCKIWRYINLKLVDKQLLADMLKYSLPLLPNSLFWWFTSVFNRYAVLFYCGSGTAGLYAAAGKLPSLVNLLSMVFQQSWQISATQEFDSRDRENVFYSKTFKVFSCVLFVGTSTLLVCVYPLSVLLLHGAFLNAWTLGPGLIVAALLTCFTSYFTALYNAAKDTIPIFKSTALGAVVNVLACVLLVYMAGEWGAVIASIVGQTTILIYQSYHSRVLISLNVDRSLLWWGSFIVAGQALSLSILGVLGVPVAICLYLVFMLYLNKRYANRLKQFAKTIASAVSKSKTG